MLIFVTNYFYVIIFIFTSVFSVVSASECCKQYLVYFDHQVTFAKALSLCNDMGLELAMPLNELEEKAMGKVLVEESEKKGLTSVNAWIGGIRCSDCSSSGNEFIWLPRGQKQVYTNFYKGEPNNAGGHQDCLIEMYRKTLNDLTEWDDDNCNKTYNYICQSDC